MWEVLAGGEDFLARSLPTGSQCVCVCALRVLFGFIFSLNTQLYTNHAFSVVDL